MDELLAWTECFSLVITIIGCGLFLYAVIRNPKVWRLVVGPVMWLGHLAAFFTFSSLFPDHEIIPTWNGAVILHGIFFVVSSFMVYLYFNGRSQ